MSETQLKEKEDLRPVDAAELAEAFEHSITWEDDLWRADPVDVEEVHTKVIRGELWETEPHKVPVCVDCHSPHEIREVFYPAGQANKDCMACHDDVDLFMERNGK